MKRLWVLFIGILFLTGCSGEEKVITNANGDSLTYKFFESSDYVEDDYTLNLRRDKQNIVIIKSGDKEYYETKLGDETVKIIEMDNYKYTINGDYYTTEPVNMITDYAAGYLPSSMDNFKTKGYKTGKERIGWLNYTYETYQVDDVITKYYFRGNKLKYIKKETALEENLVSFVSISNKVDESKFKLPKGKSEITY